MVHRGGAVSILAAFLLAASVGPPPAPAPAPTPAEASAILAEVRRPGAQATLVNVWATWCSPCVEEFPDLLHVARELAPKGLRLVLVSADFSDSTSEVKEFLTKQGVDFPSFIKAGKDEAFVDGLEPKWTGAIPVTLLYDSSGKLVKLWEGKASYPVIKKRALAALDTKENR